jgi:hypothetical protein
MLMNRNIFTKHLSAFDPPDSIFRIISLLQSISGVRMGLERCSSKGHIFKMFNFTKSIGHNARLLRVADENHPSIQCIPHAFQTGHVILLLAFRFWRFWFPGHLFSIFSLDVRRISNDAIVQDVLVHRHAAATRTGVGYFPPVDRLTQIIRIRPSTSKEF